MNVFFELPLTIVAVQGEKAANFLQGQLTCDIREVTPEQSRLAAHCNHKGRILSSMRVIHYQSQYYLLLPTSMAEITIKELNKYARLARVHLSVATDYSLLGCSGAEIETAVNSLFSTLPTVTDAVQEQENKLIICISPSQSRYLIFTPTDALNKIKKQLPDTCSKADANLWQLLDIEAGIASIYPETSDLFTPQMLNYPALNAVSFKKGCYIGQEIIARTHYLGKAKRHLQQLEIKTSTLPSPGSLLHGQDQQEVGTILAAAFDSNKNVQMLAVIQNEALNADVFWKESRGQV